MTAQTIRAVLAEAGYEIILEDRTEIAALHRARDLALSAAPVCGMSGATLWWHVQVLANGDSLELHAMHGCQLLGALHRFRAPEVHA